MNAKFLQLFRIPETRDKILATLGLMLAYRVGFQIPIPGMNAEFLTKMAEGSRGTVFGVMNAFSGGASLVERRRSCCRGR